MIRAIQQSRSTLSQARSAGDDDVHAAATMSGPVSAGSGRRRRPQVGAAKTGNAIVRHHG
jgi:hypothetical protein